jgi:hypothetical protein
MIVRPPSRENIEPLNFVIPGSTRDPAFLPRPKEAGPRVKPGATIWGDRRG